QRQVAGGRAARSGGRRLDARRRTSRRAALRSRGQGTVQRGAGSGACRGHHPDHGARVPQSRAGRVGRAVRAAPGRRDRVAPPRKDAPPATSAQFERLFADVERALASLDFFRTRNAELILRTVRSLSYRAAPDAREIELLRAIALETLRALDRSRTDP